MEKWSRRAAEAGQRQQQPMESPRSHYPRFSGSPWRAPALKFRGTEQLTAPTLLWLMALLRCLWGRGLWASAAASLQCSGHPGQENLWMQELRPLRSSGKPCQAEQHKLQSCTLMWRGMRGQKCAGGKGGEGRKESTDEQWHRNSLLSAQFLRARGWLAALTLHLGFIQYLPKPETGLVNKLSVSHNSPGALIARSCWRWIQVRNQKWEQEKHPTDGGADEPTWWKLHKAPKPSPHSRNARREMKG